MSVSGISAIAVTSLAYRELTAEKHVDSVCRTEVETDIEAATASPPKRRHVRIVYGVQNTGKGHLSRLLGLLPLLRHDGHQLLILITGPCDLPGYFLDAIAGIPCQRFPGLRIVTNQGGRVSRRGTFCAFAACLPQLLRSFHQANRLIRAFSPDLVVCDYDPVTGSPFVAPDVYKVGIGHQLIPIHADVGRLSGLGRDRLSMRVANALFTSGLDVRIISHFYPLESWCLPPILRPEVLRAQVGNRGHLLVYQALPSPLGPVVAFARRHAATPIIVYGPARPPRAMPENMRLESDPHRFIGDLASCEAYFGTAGSQSIAEAFYFGKKLAVQPIEGHYEQTWNATQIEKYGMGKWCQGDIEAALDQTLNRELHARLVPWYESGPQRHYEAILSYASAKQ